MTLAPFFLELGIIVIVATLLGLVFHKLKQPLILAYIITGIFIGLQKTKISSLVVSCFSILNIILSITFCQESVRQTF